MTLPKPTPHPSGPCPHCGATTLLAYAPGAKCAFCEKRLFAFEGWPLDAMERYATALEKAGFQERADDIESLIERFYKAQDDEAERDADRDQELYAERMEGR